MSAHRITAYIDERQSVCNNSLALRTRDLAAGMTVIALVSGVLTAHSCLLVISPGLAHNEALLATNIFVTTSVNHLKTALAILKRQSESYMQTAIARP